MRRLCKEFDGDVILTSRDERLGKEAIEKLEAEGLKPKYHQLDITSSESIERLKQHLVQQYGGVDVLVNNAAVAYKSASTGTVHQDYLIYTIIIYYIYIIGASLSEPHTSCVVHI